MSLHFFSLHITKSILPNITIKKSNAILHVITYGSIDPSLRKKKIVLCSHKDQTVDSTTTHSIWGFKCLWLCNIKLKDYLQWIWRLQTRWSRKGWLQRRWWLIHPFFGILRFLRQWPFLQQSLPRHRYWIPGGRA
jgi:hypothetical protein